MFTKYHKPFPENFVKHKLNPQAEAGFIKLAKKMSKLSFVKQSKCYICDSKTSQKVCSFYNIDYLKCTKCSHVFTNKRPSDKSLSKFYTQNKEYFSYSYTNKKILKIRLKIFQPKIKFISKFTKGKYWLDIGSGDGTAVKVIENNGFHAFGIELSESGRQYAKDNFAVNLFPEKLEEFIKLKKMKFDIISYFGVLEHLPEPMKQLRLCHKILKNDGIIAIDVPNYDSFSTEVQKLIKHPARHLYPHSHIMMFTKKSMETALAKTGFRPIAIWYWGMDMIEFLKFLIQKQKSFDKTHVKTLIDFADDFQKIFDQHEKSDEFLIIAKKIS